MDEDRPSRGPPLEAVDRLNHNEKQPPNPTQTPTIEPEDPQAGALTDSTTDPNPRTPPPNPPNGPPKHTPPQKKTPPTPNPPPPPLHPPFNRVKPPPSPPPPPQALHLQTNKQHKLTTHPP